eukprot:scaffold3384_cov27-Tisochrysis_lutea.AAC.2
MSHSWGYRDKVPFTATLRVCSHSTSFDSLCSSWSCAHGASAYSVEALRQSLQACSATESFA